MREGTTWRGTVVWLGPVLVAVACAGAGPGDEVDGDSDVVDDTDVADDSDLDGETDGGTPDDSDLDSPADSDSDAAPDCATGCAAGLYDVDDNPLTGVCGCEYACTVTSAEDAYDAAFTDANCDGGDGVVDACVYVSASLGSDVGVGTRADPARTIGAALAVAEANAVPSVCVSGETYTEVFVVPSGVTLVGSFDHLDADFPFRRGAGIVTTVNGETLP